MTAVRRRHHHHDARHACDLGRHGIHQYRRRIGGGAARHIKPDRLDRGPAMAEFDAERIGEAVVLRLLAEMECLDPVARELQRVERRGVAGLFRVGDLVRRRPAGRACRDRPGRISATARSAPRRRAPRHRRRCRARPVSTSAETSRLVARNAAKRAGKSALLAVESDRHGAVMARGSGGVNSSD